MYSRIAAASSLVTVLKLFLDSFNFFFYIYAVLNKVTLSGDITSLKEHIDKPGVTFAVILNSPRGIFKALLTVMNHTSIIDDPVIPVLIQPNLFLVIV